MSESTPTTDPRPLAPDKAPAPLLAGKEATIAYYSRHPEEIKQRLVQLDREWDSTKVTAVAAAAVSLFGLAAAFCRHRKLALLPLALIQGTLLRQALSPSKRCQSVLSQLGVRSRRDIDAERFALKALRGDFQSLPDSAEDRGSAPVLEAVRR